MNFYQLIFQIFNYFFAYQTQLVYMVKADWLLGKAIASETYSNHSPDIPKNLFNNLIDTLENIKVF